jgi:hypothetical protein
VRGILAVVTWESYLTSSCTITQVNIAARIRVKNSTNSNQYGYIKVHIHGAGGLFKKFQIS